MQGPGTKEAAESILRELPSVVGAFVREDINGNPREIHLLVLPGPEPRHLARDIRSLLQERLGVDVDQRVISIAQLARDPSLESTTAVSETTEPASGEAAPPTAPRVRFVRSESRVTEGRVSVTVELEDATARYVGEASELEAGAGRLRAGAAAALNAATAACEGRARFALDGAYSVRALDRNFALITATATSSGLGRRPVELSAAQELTEEPETAAALAALKAANRVLGLMRESVPTSAVRTRIRRR
jgi:hypothetical protein